MIKKLVENEETPSEPPLVFYRKMMESAIRPNSHTFMYLIKALINRLDTREGEEVHVHVIRTGVVTSQFVSSALLGFYVGVCCCVNRGRRVFDEMSEPGLVSWTAMIRAYFCLKYPRKALEMFREMVRLGLMPDSVAMAVVVSGCGQFGDTSVAECVHGFINKSGIHVDAFVASGLLSMYGDCGNLESAYELFLELDEKNVVMWNTMIHQCIEHKNLDLAKHLFGLLSYRDVVSWNTMVAGLSSEGLHKEALALFHEMECSDVKPNTLTLLSTLSACASLGALETGTWIHAYIERNDMNLDGSLDSGLIDMYAKCGNIDKAVQIFERSPRKNLFAWTSTICGLAMHGHGMKALHYFNEMQKANVQPDDVTLVGVLNACAHAGLLDQGWHYFRSMETDYSLTPKIEHYGCMIDLLGRKGHLKDAYELIMEMPMKANEVIWGTLLSASRVHNYVDLGEFAAKQLLELDPSDSWAQVMLSNIYAGEARWDGVTRLRKEMKDKGLRKSPGCSSTEVNGRVHEFLVGDASHPSHKEIMSMMESIEQVVKL
ncbi:E motif [Dillenia turbinata]|uniref:E motif n=1 Tax=Dillenia turbinata TaxID=194707 RepID=A0AAN8ZKL8_9MAGN